MRSAANAPIAWSVGGHGRQLRCWAVIASAVFLFLVFSHQAASQDNVEPKCAVLRCPDADDHIVACPNDHPTTEEMRAACGMDKSSGSSSSDAASIGANLGKFVVDYHNYNGTAAGADLGNAITGIAGYIADTRREQAEENRKAWDQQAASYAAQTEALERKKRLIRDAKRRAEIEASIKRLQEEQAKLAAFRRDRDEGLSQLKSSRQCPSGSAGSNSGVGTGVDSSNQLKSVAPTKTVQSGIELGIAFDCSTAAAGEAAKPFEGLQSYRELKTYNPQHSDAADRAKQWSDCMFDNSCGTSASVALQFPKKLGGNEPRASYQQLQAEQRSLVQQHSELELQLTTIRAQKTQPGADLSALAAEETKTEQAVASIEQKQEVNQQQLTSFEASFDEAPDAQKPTGSASGSAGSTEAVPNASPPF